ncbi:20170_t:CDS:2 [Gigaspora rosea]|nr:20170_t:CDS:2 [Gigaspora rosea]
MQYKYRVVESVISIASPSSVSQSEYIVILVLDLLILNDDADQHQQINIMPSENIQKDSIQKDSSSHTESHKEVQESHTKITKRRSPKTLSIPDAAFEQASRLCVEMTFKH